MKNILKIATISAALVFSVPVLAQEEPTWVLTEQEHPYPPGAIDHSQHEGDKHNHGADHSGHTGHDAPKDAPGAQRENLADRNAQTVVVRINGLVCSFCAQGIEKSLKKAGGAQIQTWVSLEHGVVAVANAKLSDQDLTAALQDAGYTVVSIKREQHSLATTRAKFEAL